MIDVRRLAAVDIGFLGSRLILIEFTLGVLGPLAFGGLTLLRSQSIQGSLIGAYLVTLGINYIPLLVASHQPHATGDG